MKSIELLKAFPMMFLFWNLNSESGIFWVNLSTLEESGMLDPWARKINLNEGKSIKNTYEEIAEWHFHSEIGGYPVRFVIVNE